MADPAVIATGLRIFARQLSDSGQWPCPYTQVCKRDPISRTNLLKFRSGKVLLGVRPHWPCASGAMTRQLLVFVSLRIAASTGASPEESERSIVFDC